jgi:hypothetical protein
MGRRGTGGERGARVALHRARSRLRSRMAISVCSSVYRPGRVWLCHRVVPDGPGVYSAGLSGGGYGDMMAGVVDGGQRQRTGCVPGPVR